MYLGLYIFSKVVEYRFALSALEDLQVCSQGDFGNSEDCESIVLGLFSGIVFLGLFCLMGCWWAIIVGY